MEQTEQDTHSFIVKIWVEERATAAGHGTWRGHITHVPTGRRHYLQDIDEISNFVAPYLEEMGVRLGRRWRLLRCLKRSAARCSRHSPGE